MVHSRRHGAGGDEVCRGDSVHRLGGISSQDLQARELQPLRAHSLITLGNIHLSQGADEQTVEAYRQAVVTGRGGVEAWDALGRAHVWRGDYANADDAYQRGLRELRELADRWAPAVPWLVVPRPDWRLLRGRADVLLRKEVERGLDGDFTEVWRGYEECADREPELSLAAHVRLAAIAAHRREPERPWYTRRPP